MPRRARFIAVGYPHHVLQRGHNRSMVFLDDSDNLVFLDLLKKYSEKFDCPVLAYCLMPNHIHLLVKPLGENSLSKAMQGISLCYAQYFNRKYHRSGRLWENRYYSCIVDKENFLWTAARYIEQNPKRAGFVDKEDEYPYSSARAHVHGSTDNVLGEEIFGKEGRTEYTDFMRGTVSHEEIRSIGDCTRAGLPFGNEAFARAIGQTFGVDLRKRPRGRPRRMPRFRGKK